MSESTDKRLLDGAMVDEQQLEEYLKGDSSVSRQYRRLEDAEVPAELDRLVLRQAAQAVKSRSTGRPAWLRWTAPLAIAASAVLALSIVIQTGLRDDTVTAVTAPQFSEPLRQALRDDSPEMERDLAQSKQSQERSADEVMPMAAAREPDLPTVAAAVPAPPPPQIDVPVREVPPVVAATSARPPRPTPTMTSPTIQSHRAAPAAAVPPGAQRRRASERSVEQSMEIAARELQAMASEVEAARRAEQQNAAIADDVARARMEEAAAAAAKAYSRDVPAAAPAAPRSYSDPEAWLKDIRELRKANKQEEADREWMRFREAFPDHEVAQTDLARPPGKQER
jgi:hypothetical protein